MFLTSFVLALALAADAFAASLIQGVAARGAVRAVAIRCGLAFGIAQGLMPLIGWGLGQAVTDVIAAWDHWIAFAILALLGAKMIKEGLTTGPEDAPAARPATGLALLVLAVATSLDAAAAGLTFDAMALSPWLACGVIGVVTAVACAGGVALGARLGPALGEKAEVIGGVALILIGIKVLVDHGALGT